MTNALSPLPAIIGCLDSKVIAESRAMYALAAKGTDTRRLQNYLGHRAIQNTVCYTQLAPGQFDGLWD